MKRLAATAARLVPSLDVTRTAPFTLHLLVFDYFTECIVRTKPNDQLNYYNYSMIVIVRNRSNLYTYIIGQ